MLKECTSLTIPIKSQYGNFNLHIVPCSQRDKLYVDDSLCSENAAYQLVESSNYQYEFESIGNHTFQFMQESEIIRFSSFKNHQNMGSINTGIYVGLLSLPVSEKYSTDEIGSIKLEIRSVKSDYESDYRHMLDDIAEYYTDLVLMQGSPVKQKLEVDDNCSSERLYQKFSFIRSMIDSDSFRESINKIITNPVRKWTETTVQRDIVSVRRLTRKNLREIATSSDRVPLSDDYRVYGVLSSIPRKISVDYKKDTIDNQENQFVKFALLSFSMFCTELRDKKHASERLKIEVERTLNQLSNYLNSLFFKQVSMPTHLNLNSPVLQRKEGYREVLQVWLMFDFAARLNWTGGDTVYDAGQKNVAVLYEYWLFFKLQELISQFFHISPADKTKLVKEDGDNIDLNIVQGSTTILHGTTDSDIRKLNIAFYYNRTFDCPKKDKNPIMTAGSWTKAMRPDYTLSIWPGEIKSEEQAEKLDLITHIHFDAKYRLNRIELRDKDDENIKSNLDEEKKQQELGVYKRADLLKMHAYKDAIRRTSGAYVIYPGTCSENIKGFHEIIPGLGAFSIRPGHWNTDSFYLKKFLAEVKDHMLDRVSQREKLSYYQYEIHRKENTSALMENLPEPIGENRDFMPDETWVLVAYCKNDEHLQWILKSRLYNLRSGLDAGSATLDVKLISARYLLLYRGNNVVFFTKIHKGGPKVYTRAQLIGKGYPQYQKDIIGEDGSSQKIVDLEKEHREAGRIYLGFDLFKVDMVEKELKNYKWNLKGLKSSPRYGHYNVVSLSELVHKSSKYEQLK